ncbi:MAG TPA: hypothetical protein VGZ24_01155, partial [Chthoniobacterales bacterium]|nr:hypothetical protein [Chthoniobacterales bacterium]
MQSQSAWHFGTLSASPGNQVEAWIATGRRRITIPPRHRMKRIGSILLAVFFFLLASGRLQA